jgi:hypothetical protein
MKKLAFVLAILALPTIALAANPTATMSLRLAADASQLKTVPQGVAGTITIGVYLDALSAVEGLTNFGGVLDSATTGVFSVATGSQRSLTGAVFQAGDIWGVTPVTSGMSGTIPQTKDFGAATVSGSGFYGNYTLDDLNAVSAAPWPLEFINVSYAALAPGDYTVGIKAGYVGTTTNDGADTWACDYTYGGGVTLHVTPEPATMLLLAGALPFLRRRH